MTEQKKEIIVSVVIVQHDKLLLIQEAKPHVYGKWNLPGGHVDYGENLLKAAKRECKEETGYDVEIPKLISIENYISKKKEHHVQFMFWGIITGGQLHYDTTEIINVAWIDISKIPQMENDFRRPSMAKILLHAITNNKFYALEIINDCL